MSFFSFAKSIFQRYDTRLTSLQQESLGTGEGNDPFQKKSFTTERRDELAFDAFTLAMKRFRRIGYLWISATGIGSPEDRAAGLPFSPAQVIYPPWRDTGDEEHIDFVRWQFDTRLTSQGLGTVLDQISDTCLENGHAVVGLEWTRETSGPYTGNAVLNDFHVYDPKSFVLDPKGLPPGIYLKRYNYAYAVSLADRCQDDLFKVVTLHKRHGNPYGISEFQLVDQALRYFWTIYEYHARGVERSGVGAYIATAGKNLVGAKLEKFIASVKNIRSNTVTFIPEGNKIDQIPADISVDAFDKLEKLCLSIVSLVGTGSATTFFENQFGTYGEKQAVDVAEKSDLEIASASLLSDFFSYQVIPLLLDKNFVDVAAYPAMQIVELDLIQPTITQDKTELIASRQDATQPEDSQASLPATQQAGTEEGQDFSSKLMYDKMFPQSTSSDTTGRFIHFAGEEKEEDDGDDDDESTQTAFPIKAPAPDIYTDVAVAAESYLLDMPVLPKRQYQSLPTDEKHHTFTVSAVGNGPNATNIITALRDAIADTLSETNEAKAWPLYRAAVKQISAQYKISLSDEDLIPSWKFARQKAYNDGIDALIDANAESLFAVRYHTQGDTHVRHTHKMFDGLTRPAGDPIWAQLILPLGFGCRCWKEPISLTMQEADPDKYTMTPDADVPKHIPAPFKEGYELEDDNTDD